MSKYYDQWKDRASVVSDYKDNTPLEEEIIYAGYTYDGDYSGAALVVFHRAGKLFENNDYHCSCYGLEEWRPEETLPGVLVLRKGWPGLDEELTRWMASQPPQSPNVAPPGAQS